MEYVERVGAKQSDIIFQFLAETVVLTGLGGLVGIVAGLFCGPAYSTILDLMENWVPNLYESLPHSMQGMEPVLVPWSLPLVFGVAVITGIVFGLYPARKASRVDQSKPCGMP